MVKIDCALKKGTDEIIYAKEVPDRCRDKYECIECKEELIGKNGKILESHFCHKPESKCKYRESIERNCLEHIKAQYKIRDLLRKGDLNIFKECIKCNFKIVEIVKQCEMIIEYRDKNKNSIYDLACVLDNKVELIIEIYNTHKTQFRYGKWFELYSSEVLEKNNNFKDSRNYECESCLNKIINQPKSVYKPYVKQTLMKCRKCELILHSDKLNCSNCNGILYNFEFDL